MPAYDFGLHEELAPYLERHPGLFGLYTEGVATGEPWTKDTGIIHHPLSRNINSRSFLARLYQTPPSSPLTVDLVSSKARTPYRRIKDSGRRYESNPRQISIRTEQDWVNKRYSPPQPEVRRRNAISRRQGRYFRTPEPDLLETDQASPQSGYDFSLVDNLLAKITSLIASSSVDLSISSRTVPSAPVQLPRHITDELNKLYTHLYCPVSSLIPLSSGRRTDRLARSPLLPTRQSFYTFPSPPRLNQNLPAPLRSHPISKKWDPEAGRYRAMRSLGYSVGAGRYLIPSIIALLTAQAVVKGLLSGLRSLKERGTQEVRASPVAATSYGVPIKAKHVLGISTPNIRADTHVPRRSQYSPATPVTAIRNSVRSTRSSASSVREIVRDFEPVSAWSPWSPESSPAIGHYSSRGLGSTVFSSRQTSYSSHTNRVDEFDARIGKLRDLERQIEAQLRTIGSWIWTSRARRSIYNDADDEMWIVDKELERCRATLVKEGYLK